MRGSQVRILYGPPDVKAALVPNMMSDFRKRMGLEEVDIAETKKKFLNRVDVSIFRWLQNNKGATFYDENFIWWISEQMGEAWGKRVRAREYSHVYSSDVTLETMTSGDFHKTLEVIEYAYEYIRLGKVGWVDDRYGYNTHDEVINLRNFEDRMSKIMLLSETDLGVFWKDGKFYPSGAKELDEALISDVLEWLNEYPNTKQQFLVALGHYEKSMQDVSAGKDAITNSYTSVEALAQEFLKNGKAFENNSNELMYKLGLPTEYKQVVHFYKQIAHEYGSRHAGSNPTHKEVEAFVYMTGLLLRLMVSN